MNSGVSVRHFPKVSVLLVTYNHSQFIDEALDSISIQDYEGVIELVVADDQSTDDTVERIRRHHFDQRRFEIRYLESSRNLGITGNYQRGFAACTGCYIAPLEGDDSWTSPARLSILVSILESNRDLVAMTNNYILFNQDTCDFATRSSVDGHGFKRIGSRYIIFDNLPGNFSACVYRRSVLETLPPALFEVKSYDWIVNICMGMFGMIGYYYQPLSIYRQHGSSVWSSKDLGAKLASQLEVIPVYKLLTRGVFDEEFDKLAVSLEHQILKAKIAQKTIWPHSTVWRLLYLARRVSPLVVIKIGKYLLPPAMCDYLKRRL